MKIKRLFSIAIFFCLSFPLCHAQFIYEWGFGVGGAFHERATSMKIDQQNNVVIAGMYGPNVDFDPTDGEAVLAGDLLSGFLAKYSKFGELIWVKDLNMETDQTSPNMLPNLDIDPLGNIYVAGYRGNLDEQRIYFAKYAPNGDLLWENELPGEDNDVAGTIHVLADGACLVTGDFSGTKDFAPGVSVTELTSEGESDLFMAKYDANGVLLWAKKLGGVIDGQTKIFQLTTAANGDIYIGGQLHKTFDFDPENGSSSSVVSCESYKAFMAKYTEAGAFQWVKKIESSVESSVHEIVLDLNGDLLLTGRFQDTMYLDSTSDSGNIIGQGWIDGYLAKYSPEGEYIWGFPVSTTSTDEGHSIAVDAENNIHLTGYFGGLEGIDLDPSEQEAHFPLSGVYDIFYAFYDESGQYIDAFTIGGEEVDVAVDLEVDDKGKVVIAGFYHSIDTDLDVTEGYDPYTATSTDIFVVKYDHVLPVTGTSETASFSPDFYPNPVNKQSVISFDGPNSSFDFEIRDSYGRLVTRSDVQNEIVSPASSGVYWMMIYKKGSLVKTRKLIVVD